MKKGVFLGFFIGFILLAFTLKDINWQETLLLLKRVNFLPIFLGLIFLGINLFLKTYRWRILLDSPVLPSRIFAILTIGYLVNNLLPARAGELARIYLMGRKEGVGMSKTLGTIIIEKTLDTFVLILILFWFGITKPVFLGIVLPQKWQERLKLLFSGLKLLKNRKILLKLLLFSFLIWTLEAFWNYSLLCSLNLKVPLVAAFFLAAVINLGLFIPSPPGYVGVFHFWATFALLPFGVDKSQALSYALLQHSFEYFILSSLGIWSAIKLSFNPLKWKKKNTSKCIS